MVYFMTFTLFSSFAASDYAKNVAAYPPTQQGMLELAAQPGGSGVFAERANRRRPPDRGPMSQFQPSLFIQS